MSDGFAAQLVTLLAWDDELTGVPSSFDEHPQFAWRTEGQRRSIRSPVRLRLDDAGGLHVLGDAGAIVHLDGDGALLGRTPPPATTGDIVDFACDGAGDCVLLERLDNGGSVGLRRLDVSGAQRWSRGEAARPATAGEGGLPGDVAKVLLHADRLYLPTAGGQDVAEVDASSGHVLRVQRQRAGAGTPVWGGGRLVAVFYDDERNRRGIVAFDPASGTSAELAGTEEHYGWLVYPFGADARQRLYVWRDGQVARVSVDGEIEILGAVDGIAVRTADGAVFTSHRESDHLVVIAAGNETTLEAPEGFRLVHIDEEGRFHLLGAEAPGSAVELRIHTADGHFASVGPAQEDLMAIECRLPTHDAWQVDADGDVVIAVVTPAGVAVVRLRRH